MYYDYVGFITAVLIAIGGAIGYFKAGIFNHFVDFIHSTMAQQIIPHSSIAKKKITFNICAFLNRFHSVTYCWFGIRSYNR